MINQTNIVWLKLMSGVVAQSANNLRYDCH